MAPTTRRGSAPVATASGSGASGGSWDRSRSQAKNLTNGRRCCVTWSRIVPRTLHGAGAATAGPAWEDTRSPPAERDLPRAGRVELLRGVDEIARVDDVVAVEHLAGFPADHLHRDPLGDARADEIADGGPAEIVEDAAGHPSRATRR